MYRTTDAYGTRVIYLSLDEGASEYETTSLDIELDIFESTKTVPVLGNLANIDPLKWDKTIVASSIDPVDKYNSYTETIDFSLRDGTFIDDWQSGTVLDLEFIDLKNDWEPIFNTGTYSSSSETRGLYSDYSLEAYFSPYVYDDNNRYYVELDSSFIEDSIKIRQFKLSNNLLYETVLEYNKVDSFSDDTYSNEFIVEGNRITINNNPFIRKGENVLPQNKANIEQYYNLLGTGNDSTKDFYIPYLPIDEFNIETFVIYDDDTTEKWKIVDSLDFATREDTYLKLDKEKGVITCGGKSYDNLVLKESITDSDIDITFYTTKDISSYPKKGILNIEGEQILFIDRTHNQFLNCIRGYNGSIAAAHGLSASIEIERNGFAIPEEASLYIFYYPSLRVDYEISYYSIRSSEITVRPSSHIDANKIVQIAPRLLDLDSLYLYSEAPVLGHDRYGPLYYGSDTARCIVEAKDSYDNPVSNLNITLEILDPIIGTLDGENFEVIKVSDYNGRIYAYYNSPVDEDNFSKKYNEVEYNDSLESEFLFEGLDEDTELEDIFIFQIFKQDPVFGSSGIKYSIISHGTDSTYTETVYYIELENPIDSSYLNGVVYAVDSNNVVYTRTIKYILNNKIFIEEALPTETYSYVYISKQDDLTWDSEELNGVAVILYQWNADAVHPITGSSGAYTPIFPVSITDETILYQETFPQSEPEDSNNNLGGYMIIAPRTVYLRAKATDPYSGNLVYSNTIEFKLLLPSYLTGVSFQDGLPVPIGFNFAIDENNYDTGTGLGGSNFITINKSGGLYGLQLRFNS